MGIYPLDYLHRHHLNNCAPYKQIIQKIFPNEKNFSEIYLHVGLFKKIDFITGNTIKNYKYSSSGTSGKKSNIHFDRTDAINQQKYLLKTIKSFTSIHKEAIFVDAACDTKEQFNARRAASRGFSLLSKKRVNLPSALEESYQCLTKLANESKQIILFGFTYEIFTLLENLTEAKFPPINNSNFLVIHGGGWKKLEKKKVDNEVFIDLLRQIFKNSKSLNYYGMVEQLGLIYPMCEEGFYHCPEGSNIIIRDNNGKVSLCEKEGLIQSISPLPISYPGHSLLTEDIGLIFSSPCKCGLKTKRFKVLGRLNKSDSRGCSDAY